MGTVRKSDSSNVTRKPRNPGRPRSESSRTSIFSAVLKLLATKSLRDISIEEIAFEAGVSKATVYRWWSNKTQLAIDAFLNDISVKAPFVVRGTITDTIVSQVHALADQYRGRDGEILRQIIAECQASPEDMKIFHQKFLFLRREEAKRYIRIARKDGVIASKLDDDTIIDMIYGPIYYRLLLRHARIDKSFVKSIVDHVFKQFGPIAVANIRPQS